MNHFMARLIFCFFAEDTHIFHGDGLFTQTVQQMTEADGSNVDFVLGWLLRKLEYDIAPFVLAFVLAPLLEQSLRQSMTMSGDGAMILFQRPVSAGLVAASMLLLVLIFIRQFQRKRGDS